MNQKFGTFHAFPGSQENQDNDEKRKSIREKRKSQNVAYLRMLNVFFIAFPLVKEKYAPNINKIHVSIPKCSKEIQILGRFKKNSSPDNDSKKKYQEFRNGYATLVMIVET